MDFRKIRNARKQAGFTQARLAELLDVNRATISKYENGEISPPVEQLELMAKHFGIPLGLLVTGKIEIIPGRLWIVEEEDPQGKNIVYTVNAQDEEAYAIGLQLFAKNGIGPEHMVEARIGKALNKLNTEGKKAAVERVEELTEIPKYKNNPQE